MPTEPSSPGWTRTTDRLLVRELPSPLGHRTMCALQWTHSDLHQDFQHATPASSCWTMSPILCGRFAFCDPSSRHAPKDSNPDQLGWNQSCCQLHQGRIFLSGRRGTRTPKRLTPPPVFKTGSSSGRMPSVCKLRRQESNLRHDGSEPPARASTGPTASVVRDTLDTQKLGEKDLNLHLLLQRQAAYH